MTGEGAISHMPASELAFEKTLPTTTKGSQYYTFKSKVYIRDGSDSSFAGYPAILKTGYRFSGRISGGCRIPDISDIEVTQIIETSQIFKQK